MQRGIVLRRLLPVLIALMPVLAFCEDAAPDKYLELMRTDLKAKKVEILTEALALSPQQAETFWPIYRQYDVELAKLSDQRIALIKDYAQAYRSMTDATADSLASRAFDLEARRLALLRQYHKKVGKAVSPIIAARFAQVEATINTLVDLQIRSELPLIEVKP